jgi:hypothetical protein
MEESGGSGDAGCQGDGESGEEEQAERAERRGGRLEGVEERWEADSGGESDSRESEAESGTWENTKRNSFHSSMRSG